MNKKTNAWQPLAIIGGLYLGYEIILGLIPEFQKFYYPIGTIIQLLSLLVISYYIYINTIKYQKPPHPKNIYLSKNYRISPIIIGIGLWIIELIYNFGINIIHPLKSSSSNQNYIVQLLHQHNATVVLIIASTIIIAPIIEESIFRGIILGYRFSNQYIHFIKLGLSITLFISIHIINDIDELSSSTAIISFLINLGAYIIITLVLTLHFELTHNLKNNIIIHSVYNTLSVIAILI